jgi:hypothetical protein
MIDESDYSDVSMELRPNDVTIHVSNNLYFTCTFGNISRIR